MQLIRAFSIRITNSNISGHFKLNRSYEVLATDIENGLIYFLVVDEKRKFQWVRSTDCELAFLHDL